MAPFLCGSGRILGGCAGLWIRRQREQEEEEEEEEQEGYGDSYGIAPVFLVHVLLFEAQSVWSWAEGQGRRYGSRKSFAQAMAFHWFGMTIFFGFGNTQECWEGRRNTVLPFLQASVCLLLIAGVFWMLAAMSQCLLTAWHSLGCCHVLPCFLGCDYCFPECVAGWACSERNSSGADMDVCKRVYKIKTAYQKKEGANPEF